ncbi:MAG: DUF429 domain-containing protein [Actinomycetota bacterium]
MTTNAPVHIGIDLAWGQKNWTGLAAVSADGRLLASGRARTDDDIVAWMATHAPSLGVVAIDAPLVVTNPAGRRHCESLIHAAFGRFDASPHSTNLGKPEFNPPRGAVLADRFGLPLDPAARTAVAIEVYPHPAMVGLWELDLILKYKHKTKYAFDHRKEQFARLLDLLEGEDSLAVTDVPRWWEIRQRAAKASKHGELNLIEDEVDGIFCGWLAWLWATEDARLLVHGDLARGYIVAPGAPTHDPRPRADRVAPKRVVRFEEPIPARVPLAPIVSAPEFGLDGPSARWPLTPAEARGLELELRRVRADVSGVLS